MWLDSVFFWSFLFLPENTCEPFSICSNLLPFPLICFFFAPEKWIFSTVDFWSCFKWNKESSYPRKNEPQCQLVNALTYSIQLLPGSMQLCLKNLFVTMGGTLVHSFKFYTKKSNQKSRSSKGTVALSYSRTYGFSIIRSTVLQVRKYDICWRRTKQTISSPESESHVRIYSVLEYFLRASYSRPYIFTVCILLVVTSGTARVGPTYSVCQCIMYLAVGPILVGPGPRAYPDKYIIIGRQSKISRYVRRRSCAGGRISYY